MTLQKTKTERVKRIALWVVFAAYLLFNLFLLAEHELWRDEANVWIMARELSPLQLFREIKYQGHPCLWYLLIMPFAKIGLPFRTIEAVSFLVMAVTTGLYLFRAPVCRPVKAVTVFCPMFTYFYSDIARNYCLIALLLMLLACSYSERNQHPFRYGLLLGLLVQADTIAIPFAGMIALMWFAENAYGAIKERNGRPFWNMLRGCLIPLVSLLLWAAQFYQVSDSPVFQINDTGLGDFLHGVRNYAYSILIRMTGAGQTLCLVFMAAVFLLLLVLSVRLKNIGCMSMVVAAFLFQAAFSAVVYQLHIWHFISLCFAMIWGIWVLHCQQEEKRPGDGISRAALWGLEILLAILALFMFANWNSDREPSNLRREITGLYSDGGNAARYIKENLSKGDLIFSTDVAMDSTILAYLPGYTFRFAVSGEVESYADWSESQSGTITFAKLLELVRERFADTDEFYLIWSKDCCLREAEALEECEIVYQTGEETVRGEEYIIYRIIAGAQKGRKR